MHELLAMIAGAALAAGCTYKKKTYKTLKKTYIQAIMLANNVVNLAIFNHVY